MTRYEEVSRILLRVLLLNLLVAAAKIVLGAATGGSLLALLRRSYEGSRHSIMRAS